MKGNSYRFQKRFQLQYILLYASYSNAARRVSSQFHDQPMTPREVTVYWSEYVIRHKGAHHLRSAAMDLNWIEYNNIDVLIILLFAILLFITLVCIMLRWFWQRYISTQKIDSSSKKVK